MSPEALALAEKRIEMEMTGPHARIREGGT